MHNIYNCIVSQTNEQLQEKAASDATFQAVKTGRILDDTQEDLLIEPIWTAPQPVSMPGNQATVQQNPFHRWEHDRLPCQVPEWTEGQWGV